MNCGKVQSHSSCHLSERGELGAGPGRGGAGQPAGAAAVPVSQISNRQHLADCQSTIIIIMVKSEDACEGHWCEAGPG